MNPKLRDFLIREKIISQENHIFHAGTDLEMLIIKPVENGDFDEFLKLSSLLCGSYSKNPFSRKRRDDMAQLKGQLSDDPLRDLKYHFVIEATIIFRTAEKAGVPRETAHTMSDYFIRQMDLLSDEDDINALALEMVHEFCDEVHFSKQENQYSQLVQRCIQYIKEHNHVSLRLKDISDETGYSTNWISKQFLKETGIPITEYIHTQKIHEAKNLLRYTDEPISAISSLLGYSSQSYFTQIFYKQEGLLPNEYRNSNTLQ